MSLAKSKIITSIEILNTGEIQVLYCITVTEGDEVHSKKTHYEVFAPGADISAQPPAVQAAAAAAWTPELMAATTARIVTQAQEETVTRNAATAEAQAALAQHTAAQEAADAARAQAEAAAAAANAATEKAKAALQALQATQVVHAIATATATPTAAEVPAA